MVPIAAGASAQSYRFGERPDPTGPVQPGQAGLGSFWASTRGQALIKALNGGAASTQLASWLAATLPNTFGASAGANNLSGQGNMRVATFFKSAFRKDPAEAEMLATALSVYVTNATLDNTKVAATYGFTVAGDGLGTATFNVGANGAAFGLANNTTMMVIDLLRAADSQSLGGVLYNGDATKQKAASATFAGVNQAGGVM
jgi:hypothetical protein